MCELHSTVYFPPGLTAAHDDSSHPEQQKSVGYSCSYFAPNGLLCPAAQGDKEGTDADTHADQAPSVPAIGA